MTKTLLGRRTSVQPSLCRAVPLLLFPLHVERSLVIGKHGIDLPIGLLLYTPAGVIFGAVVTGGVVSDTIQGDVPVDEDHLELEDLVLCEMQLFFETFELFCGLLGGSGFGFTGQGGIDGLGMRI